MSEIPETDPLSYMNPTSLTDGAVACEAAFGDGTGDSSPPRPIDLLAAMMIDAALEGHPELVDAATVRGAVVVLVVPRGWHEDVAACWRQHVLGHDLRDNDVAKAMDYMLNRQAAFTRFLDDGRICLTNNAAERALRGIAIGRKAWLLAGSDRGGERAAAMYSLIASAKLNGVDPRAWLADVLARIADHPASRLDELLPWNWRKTRLAQAAA